MKGIENGKEREIFAVGEGQTRDPVGVSDPNGFAVNGFAEIPTLLARSLRGRIVVVGDLVEILLAVDDLRPDGGTHDEW